MSSTMAIPISLVFLYINIVAL